MTRICTRNNVLFVHLFMPVSYSDWQNNEMLFHEKAQMCLMFLLWTTQRWLGTIKHSICVFLQGAGAATCAWPCLRKKPPSTSRTRAPPQSDTAAVSRSHPLFHMTTVWAKQPIRNAHFFPNVAQPPHGSGGGMTPKQTSYQLTCGSSVAVLTHSSAHICPGLLLHTRNTRRERESESMG